jgi:hypothetical protein
MARKGIVGCKWQESDEEGVGSQGMHEDGTYRWPWGDEDGVDG